MDAALSIVILSTVTTTGLYGQPDALLGTLLHLRKLHLSPWKSRLTWGSGPRALMADLVEEHMDEVKPHVEIIEDDT